VFGDSVADLTNQLKDATKFLAPTAEVVPGLPAGLGGATTPATQGKLKTDVEALDAWYGVFIGLPINTFLGRTSLGEMRATQAVVERDGRLIVRRAVFQTPSGTGEVFVDPFTTAPVATDIGKLVDAVEVAPSGTPGINPFTTSIMKWQIAGGAGNGFADVARITNVSDDGTEVEIEIITKVGVYGAV
jgi:hypothetical protein